MYYDGLKKIARILAYQTLFVKWGYNMYMGRNYFSKAGGPYFVNDGFSRHAENSPKPSNKKDIQLFACGAVGILGILYIGNLLLIKLFN